MSFMRNMGINIQCEFTQVWALSLNLKKDSYLEKMVSPKLSETRVTAEDFTVS